MDILYNCTTSTTFFTAQQSDVISMRRIYWYTCTFWTSDYPKTFYIYFLYIFAI